MTATVTVGGVRLAPAGPHTTPDGQVLPRVGLWPVDGAPMVFTVDEVAVALAWSGRRPSRYGLGAQELAGRTLAGVDVLGRDRLRVLAARCRHDTVTDTGPEVWPHGGQSICRNSAQTLCQLVGLATRTT